MNKHDILVTVVAVFFGICSLAIILVEYLSGQILNKKDRSDSDEGTPTRPRTGRSSKRKRRALLAAFAHLFAYIVCILALFYFAIFGPELEMNFRNAALLLFIATTAVISNREIKL
jgi:membrane associated rhomboid family serine protease